MNHGIYVPNMKLYFKAKCRGLKSYILRLSVGD